MTKKPRTALPTPSPHDLTTAEYKRLDIICRAIARKLRPRFKPFAVDFDDLCSVAMYGATAASLRGALNGHITYCPPRSYSGYAGTCANNALLAYHEQLQRQRRGDDAAIPAIIEALDLSEAGPTESTTLQDSLPRNIGERGFHHPPTAYAQALAHREEHQPMSFSQLHPKLPKDEPFCKLIGFKRPPARSSILLAQRRLRHWASKHP